MSARRFCDLRGQEVLLEDRAMRTLEHATTINAGSTSVLVEPAAWRFLNSIGVANARALATVWRSRQIQACADVLRDARRDALRQRGLHDKEQS